MNYTNIHELKFVKLVDNNYSMRKEYLPILNTFNRLAPHYGSKHDMEEANRRALAPLIAAVEGRILDVGCGAGTLISKYFTPSRHEIFTMDFSEKMTEIAVQRLDPVRNNIFFVRGFAPALPFSSCAFDAVVCVNTIHNFPFRDDVIATFYEFNRVLKAGGKLFLEFRNSYNPRRRSVATLYNLPSLPQRIYSSDQIKKMLNKAGFEVQKLIPIFSASTGKFPSPTVVFRNKIYNLLIPWFAPCMGMIAVKTKN
ncbi:MAG: class I SAM-dependent methyltransferase [bacterium]